MKADKLPQTDLIQELADFWDSHDLTDFESELEEVTEPIFERDKVVKVYLSANEAETLENMARLRGLQPGDLIRDWIREKARGSS